jgi:hypothetical protein
MVSHERMDDMLHKMGIQSRRYAREKLGAFRLLTEVFSYEPFAAISLEYCYILSYKKKT